MPLLPFFVINLLMGLTTMKAWTFYWVSQLGMLAGTLVYVNAGTQLAKIESLKGILSPGLLGSFVLLGVFPLIAKKIVDAVQGRKVYARWASVKPKTFDRNLVVIGAGAAGLVTSLHRRGGEGQGHAGREPQDGRRLPELRLRAEQGADQDGQAAAADARRRSSTASRARRPTFELRRRDGAGGARRARDRAARFGGALHRPGRGRGARATRRSSTRGRWRSTLGEGRRQTLTTRSIVIATGAQPFVPPLPGLDDVGYVTSDTLWGLRELPQRLVVLGGGPIGCELAQSFARLGSQVTQVEMAPRIMIREDEEVSALAQAALEHDGVAVLTGHKALRCELVDGRKFIVVEAGGAEKRIEFDQLLCAVGRVARLKGYGLEELGIAGGRTVETNEYLQTVYPNIFAAGDVAGPYQFTHTAAHQAWYAAVNALFGGFKKFKADYSVIPWATFTDPEVARVGLNEQEAKEKGIAVRGDDATASTTSTAPSPTAPRTASSRCSPCRARTASSASPSSARMPATCSPNTCWRCATAWA